MCPLCTLPIYIQGGKQRTHLYVGEVKAHMHCFREAHIYTQNLTYKIAIGDVPRVRRAHI